MIKLCKLDINNLIINYLSDEGYSHTLFTFKNEIKSIENVNFTFKLKDIIAKGLQFIYLEKHIKNGKFYECRSEFTLNSEHFCILNDDFSSDYEDAITNFNKTKAQVDCNKEKLFFENHESKEKEFLSLENEFTENVNELEAGKNECENSNKNNCKNSNLFANEEDIKKNAEKNEENLCFSKELNELALEKQKIDFNKLNKKKNYTKSQITQNLSVGNSQKRLKKSIREKK
ncbi:hypothetical protein EDEG_00809 [Edhazardia aedis USNM 41457]|uniref:Uncharacterized protein n=1 Tax=Edhazardia aedis (strain USNM 41457) TaxID=1003232 RepID=J9DBJ8_EDHAE|nr:hypothetical protein EDEG_00809 [Edhazardia aedis USNM 41457]|eukprot:EJW05096.1 hypothetical protein EDEG_00809 [Edhazardia aedis USNM 41457]